MKALIIKKQWLDLILEGKKSWEIRGSNTKIRGQIELIQSGSGLIVGRCDIVDSIELTRQQYENSFDKHCISDISILPYKKAYAWVINNPIRYKNPRKYKHPKGAVIWVKIEEE